MRALGTLGAAGLRIDDKPTAPVNSLLDPKWAMLRETQPAEWDLEAMYEAARGAPVSDKPVVAIVVPGYRETERVAQVCRVSRNAVRLDLEKNGIPSMVWPIVGDSLICRMRQRACHLFMLSGATHMLQWDGDIECLTPGCVAAMVATGHDVIAGACPFKTSERRTVVNLWPEDEGRPLEVVDGCVDVQDAGTGLMMVTRKAILTLMQAHPELLHWSISMDSDRGAPLWSLFDTGVINGVYQSEDYYFCDLWQRQGGKVWVYVPAQFRHWGEHGFEASFEEQHGIHYE